MIDANSHTSTTSYDVMGRETGTTDAVGDRTTMTYDASGLELTSSDANANQTSMIYDTYNRGLVVSTIQGVGTQAQTADLTTYDNAGQANRQSNGRRMDEQHGLRCRRSSDENDRSAGQRELDSLRP